MKIKKLLAKSIHGYYDFDIDFQDDINFLIGLNGSGKTTVLKIITSIFDLDFEYLSSLEFKDIELSIQDDKRVDRKIKLKNNKDGVSLLVSGIKGEIKNSDSKKPLFLSENNFIFESSGQVEDYIKNLPKILFLGLNRISNRKRKKNDSKNYADHIMFGYNEDQYENMIDNAKDLIRKHVDAYNNEKNKIEEEFKYDILKSSIKPINTDDITDLSKWEFHTSRYHDLRKFISLKNHTKELMRDTFRVTDSKKILEDLDDFFESLEETVNRAIQSLPSKNEAVSDNNENQEIQFKNVLLHIYLKSHVDRLDDIRAAIDRYSERKKVEYKKVRLFHEEYNNFLNDTNKEGLIDAGGNVWIHTQDKHKTTVDQLSSGELQLFVILTYLIFSDQKTKPIVIIDEPELSLHLHWQTKFVTSVSKVNPDAQFILATHSPDIIDIHRNKSISLDKNKGLHE